MYILYIGYSHGGHSIFCSCCHGDRAIQPFPRFRVSSLRTAPRSSPLSVPLFACSIFSAGPSRSVRWFSDRDTPDLDWWSFSRSLKLFCFSFLLFLCVWFGYRTLIVAQCSIERVWGSAWNTEFFFCRVWTPMCHVSHDRRRVSAIWLEWISLSEIYQTERHWRLGPITPSKRKFTCS